MAVSWATVAYPPNQLPLCSTAVAGDVATSTSRYCNNFLKVYSSRRRSFGFHVTEKHTSIRTLAVEPSQVSSLRTHQGTWEDPDDGSGSEYDEEDENEDEEENDLDFESDSEEDKDALATARVQKSQKDKYEEDLVKGNKGQNYKSLCLVSLQTYDCNQFTDFASHEVSLTSVL